ncbi:Butyryl-CoA dehydrogenase [compost metagenome]
MLGGAGYTREYPLVQYYRDNRLNPIHEGTEGIQGIDLLARKLGPRGGEGFALFIDEVERSLTTAHGLTDCAPLAAALGDALGILRQVTAELQGQVAANPDPGLANATTYLDLFGRVLVGWIWLRQALVASRALAAGANGSEHDFYRGKLQAARYFMEWELAQVEVQARLLSSANRTCFDMQDAWF